MMPRGKKKDRPVQSSPPKLDLVRLFWLGVWGAMLGAIVETVFMLLTRGELQSRSSLLFGQFSLVWGGGAVLFTVALRRYAHRGPVVVFLAAAFWGTAFELICSFLAEAWFGVLFWDYSHLPLSIGGRINLIFSCFWGAAGSVWTLAVLPRLTVLFDRSPKRLLVPATVVMALFLLVSAAMTYLALDRLSERQQGLPPQTAVDRFFDQHWDDQRLYRRFANMRQLEGYSVEHPNFW